MQPLDQQDDLVRGLVERRGVGVIHLPYTPEFEAMCFEAVGRTPSDGERHALWERILELRARPQTISHPNAAPPVQAPPVPAAGTTAHPASPILPDSISVQGVAELPAFSELLFDDDPVPAQQPWGAPLPPALAPDVAEERKRMLADIADSRLGSTEQRVAYLLHYFPETRDSDIALCLRYWRRFQADVL